MAQWVRWKTAKMTCVSLNAIEDVYNAAFAPRKAWSRIMLMQDSIKKIRTLLNTVLVRSLVVLVVLSSSYTLCAFVIFLLVVVALL